MKRADEDLFGLTMSHVAAASLGEAPRQAEGLPAGGPIAGAAKRCGIHKSFDQQRGCP